MVLAMMVAMRPSAGKLMGGKLATRRPLGGSASLG
jgi:hypothetical protein